MSLVRAGQFVAVLSAFKMLLYVVESTTVSVVPERKGTEDLCVP